MTLRPTIALSDGRRARTNGIAVPRRQSLATVVWWRRLLAWARAAFRAAREA